MKNKTSVCTKKKKPNEKAEDEPVPPQIKKNITEKIWVEDQILLKKIITSLTEISYEKSRRTGKIVAHRKTLEVSSVVEKYVLELIDKKELALIRALKEPVFIVKEGDNLYFTKIPYNMSLLNTLCVEHKCAPRDGICKRLSPNPDSLGGCAKVRDDEAHIENYNWIKKGYETANTDCDSFIVIECDHHEMVYEKSVKKNKEKTEKKVGRKNGKADQTVESIWDKISIRF